MVVEHPVLLAKKIAARERVRLWQQNNPEKYRAGRERRKEADKELQRKRRKERPEVHAAAAALYRQRHPEKAKAAKARSMEKNPELYAAYKAKWSKDNRWRARDSYRRRSKEINQKWLQRRRECPEIRLVSNLRTRLNVAIRQGNKAGSAVRDLGCSIPDLRRILESQWQEGWSWENWGTVWVIDHFFPISWANLEDRAELLAVVNYRNLRALSRQDNADKSDSVCAIAQHLFNGLVLEFRAAVE